MGAGLLQLFLQCGWINAVNESRALLVTDLGLAEINRLATA